MSTIEERLDALEKRAPVRGPAGDISAAVRNATIASNAAVADAESRIKATADEALARVQDEAVKFSDLARKLRQEVEDAKKFLDDRIQNAVDANLVKTLQEYHLLDASCTPTHWSK